MRCGLGEGGLLDLNVLQRYVLDRHLGEAVYRNPGAGDAGAENLKFTGLTHNFQADPAF